MSFSTLWPVVVLFAIAFAWIVLVNSLIEFCSALNWSAVTPTGVSGAAGVAGAAGAAGSAGVAGVAGAAGFSGCAFSCMI